MKKLMAILLVLLLLTGCGAAPGADDAAPPDKKPVEEPVTSPPAVLPEQTLRFAMDTTLHGDTVYAETGEALLTYTFHVPVLTVQREDGSTVAEAQTPAEERALTVAKTFNDRFAEWATAVDIQEVTAMAAEHLKMVKEVEGEWYSGYQLELSCSVHQIGSIISVSGLYYSYTGGAHPNTSYLSWNYDTEAAAFLDAKMLGSGTELQDAVAAEIERQAAERVEEGIGSIMDTYWEDYKTIMADWSSCAVSFGPDGMTVIFSPYELAPYAAGPQEFSVSYEWLTQHLSDQGAALLGLNKTA